METLGKHSPRLKEFRRRVRDRRPGEVIVDGRLLISDLVRWEIPIRELYVASGVDLEETLLGAAERKWVLDPSVFASVAPTKSPQGVLAVVDEPDHEPWPARGGVALCLDGVQDPGNVGAMVRCAAGLGAQAVLLSPGCADPFGWAAVRGSAGAVFRIPVESDVEIGRVAQRVREGKGEVWASKSSGTPVERWQPAEPTLLLMGAEGGGLSETCLSVADGTVAVPLDREIDSLNVAVAAGILLQHLRSS